MLTLALLVLVPASPSRRASTSSAERLPRAVRARVAIDVNPIENPHQHFSATGR